jgi:hypothetical protein
MKVESPEHLATIFEYVSTDGSKKAHINKNGLSSFTVQFDLNDIHQGTMGFQKLEEAQFAAQKWIDGE